MDVLFRHTSIPLFCAEVGTTANGTNQWQLCRKKTSAGASIIEIRWRLSYGSCRGGVFAARGRGGGEVCVCTPAIFIWKAAALCACFCAYTAAIAKPRRLFKAVCAARVTIGGGFGSALYFGRGGKEIGRLVVVPW